MSLPLRNCGGRLKSPITSVLKVGLTWGPRLINGVPAEVVIFKLVRGEIQYGTLAQSVRAAHS